MFKSVLFKIFLFIATFQVQAYSRNYYCSKRNLLSLINTKCQKAQKEIDSRVGARRGRRARPYLYKNYPKENMRETNRYLNRYFKICCDSHCGSDQQEEIYFNCVNNDRFRITFLRSFRKNKLTKVLGK